jgi:chromosome segregation ATPase
MYVYLEENPCISEAFENPTEVAVLQQTVNEKCHFEETPTSPPPTTLTSTTTAPTSRFHDFEALKSLLAQFESGNEKLEAELTSLKSEITTLNQKNTNLNKELENMKAENLKLEDNLINAKSDHERQLSLFNNFHNELNAKCIAKNNKLRNKFNFKVQENGELNDKVQQKETEIISKDNEIEKLKKKVQFYEENEY